MTGRAQCMFRWCFMTEGLPCDAAEAWNPALSCARHAASCGSVSLEATLLLRESMAGGAFGGARSTRTTVYRAQGAGVVSTTEGWVGDEGIRSAVRHSR